LRRWRSPRRSRWPSPSTRFAASPTSRTWVPASAPLWVLIIGGLVATLTAAPAMHFALAVGGAVVFSLYIVYDVHLIAKRLSPDEYVPAAISLYLDIVNLFLHILRILAELQGRD